MKKMKIAAHKCIDMLPLKKKLELIREAKEALKSGKHYRSAQEMHRDILGE